ncbi:MAG: PEP-CTERM sorting domain-containing protein [Burkholderiales bacterium]
MALAAPASAVVVVGLGAFSGSATTITFEDTAGDFSQIPAGYGSAQGISMSARTLTTAHAAYGTTLANVATAEGLGDIAASYGCLGDCGTGFSLAALQTRVGFWFGSNVPTSGDVVEVLRAGVVIGSFSLTAPQDDMEFIGFEDLAGIDQIRIPGPDITCNGCIYQLDNVMFERGGAVPEPGTLVLLGLAFAGLGIRRRKIVA